MVNPYYFFEENLKIGFKVILGSHNNIHANSILTITPMYSDFGFETSYVKKILKEMVTIYARLINQYKFKCHKFFSASLFEKIEEHQRSDETELFNTWNISHKLTETDLNNIDVKAQLVHQIQTQELKESGWIFDKITSMRIRFYETGELNGSNYVKSPLRSNAILFIENVDIFCFISSILVYLHPCENDHPNRVSNCRQHFNK